jgi:ParB family chromosome partitioning protein
MGYEQLIAEFSYNQNQVAKVIGKSRSHVANCLRLLKLPDEVKLKVRDGLLSAGHARALIGRDDAVEAANRIVSKGLSVRDVEAMTGSDKQQKKSSSEQVQTRDANIADLEKRIEDALGFEVVLVGKGERGELRIRYATAAQLDVLCQRLGVK